MTKNLKLIKEGNDYALISLDDNELKISIHSLKIDSKEIYDKILKDVNETTFKFNISTELLDKEEIRIFEQIKMLFSKIEENLNKINSE